MRDFFKRQIAPLIFENSSNAVDSTSSRPTNTSTEITPVSSSNTSSSKAMVLRSSSRQDLFDNDFDSKMIENATGALRQVNSQAVSTFPTSAALLRYYSHRSHFEHLNGIVPLNVSQALSVRKPMDMVLSTTTSQVSPHKRARSAVSRDNALDTLSSKVLLPPTSVKPVFLNEEQYIECCVIATFIHVLKKGATLEDSILLQNLFRGLPGKNITNLQFMGAKLRPLKSPVDFRNYISPDLLNSLPPEIVEKLGAVTLTVDATFVHEVVAMAKTNSQQTSQLTFTGSIRNSDGSSNPSWFYNNSGNSFPDYHLTLTEAVGEYTHMGVDFKFTKKSRGNYDILKGCSDNLEYHVRNLSRELHNNVRQVPKNPRIIEKDQYIAKEIISQLDKNTANYSLSKDVDHYVSSYNTFREAFSDFFIRNKIGVNLIAPISVDDMSLNLDVKQEFSKTFNHFYLSENSSLLNFLNDLGRNQNTSSLDTKEIMLSYAKEFFSDLVE